LESGPAAGAVGCASLARLLRLDRLISFDMGGTTAKCAIVDNGMVQTTDEYHVDGRPLRIPVIDIREVSAGGGTIAWIDAGGALALGPQSAGAAPGPVCYGLDGTEPTVTDANVVLGRIDGSRFLGGTMPLDAAGAARAVLEPLEATDAAWAQARYAEMQREVAAILPGDGAPLMHRAVDLRYVGQEHTVTIAVTDLGDWADLRKQFDDAHERAYGYAASDVDVQLLNLRLTVVFPIERPRLPSLPRRTGTGPAFAARTIYSVAGGDFVEHGVVQRSDLFAGDTIEGPAAIEEPGTTTIIDAGD